MNRNLFHVSLVLSLAALAGVAGCASDGADEDVDVMADTNALGKTALAADFKGAANGSVVYQDGDYAEVKSEDGTRLLVVSGDNIETAKGANEVKGEDFKLMGPRSPVPGVVVLGENELKAKFYERHGIDM